MEEEDVFFFLGKEFSESHLKEVNLKDLALEKNLNLSLKDLPKELFFFVRVNKYDAYDPRYADSFYFYLKDSKIPLTTGYQLFEVFVYNNKEETFTANEITVKFFSFFPDEWIAWDFRRKKEFQMEKKIFLSPFPVYRKIRKGKCYEVCSFALSEDIKDAIHTFREETMQEVARKSFDPKERFKAKKPLPTLSFTTSTSITLNVEELGGDITEFYHLEGPVNLSEIKFNAKFQKLQQKVMNFFNL